MVLDADLEPHLRSDEPIALSPALELRWERLKTRHTQLAHTLARRFERALVTQRRWSIERWDAHIAPHPLWSCLAERLIWRAFNTRGRPLQVWRIDEAGERLDINDVRIDPLKSGSKSPLIGLAHPLHVPLEQRERWLALLTDYEVIQPFAQMNRTYFEEPPTHAQWLELYGKHATHEHLHAMFMRHQWNALPTVYLTSIIPGYGIYPKLAGSSRRTSAQFKFHPIKGIDRNPAFRHETFELEKCINLKRIKWDKVDAIERSELWRSMSLTFRQ